MEKASQFAVPEVIIWISESSTNNGKMMLAIMRVGRNTRSGGKSIGHWYGRWVHHNNDDYGRWVNDNDKTDLYGM